MTRRMERRDQPTARTKDTAMTSNRTYGVELEIIHPSQPCDMDEVARIITAAGVACVAERYNHTTREHWKVITDGSVHNTNSQSGCEVVSPVLAGEAGLAVLATVCNALQAAGYTVNKTCGMHVHVGASDLTVAKVKTLVKTWLKYEDSLECLVAESRRGQAMFCKSNVQTVTGRRYTSDDAQNVIICEEAFAKIDACTTLDAIRSLFRSDRYHKLNLESLWRHRTVEIRLHQGSVNATKACEWVRLCVGMVEGAATRSRILPRKAHGHTAAVRVKYLLEDCVEDTSSRLFFQRRKNELCVATAE